MNDEQRREIRGSRKASLTGWLAGWVMRVFGWTLRIEVDDRAGLAGVHKGPVIYALWHNRIFVVPGAWRKAFGRTRRAVVLTSASHDGAMLARAVGVFGIGAVRGSSSRRGVAALVAMRKALRQGSDVCVTPDGPRGPRYRLQPGLVKLAETSTAPVVPVHVEFGAAWRLKSWDRFHVPKPFSRVRVVFDRALAVPAALSEDDFEGWRARIEEVLNAEVGDLES